LTDAASRFNSTWRDFIFVDICRTNALGTVQTLHACDSLTSPRARQEAIDDRGDRRRQLLLSQPRATARSAIASACAARCWPEVAAQSALGSRNQLRRHGVTTSTASVTTDIAEAVRDADLILCPTPPLRAGYREAARAASQPMGNVGSCRPRPSARRSSRQRRVTPATSGG